MPSEEFLRGWVAGMQDAMDAAITMAERVTADLAANEITMQREEFVMKYGGVKALTTFVQTSPLTKGSPTNKFLVERGMLPKELFEEKPSEDKS